MGWNRWHGVLLPTFGCPSSGTYVGSHLARVVIPCRAEDGVHEVPAKFVGCSWSIDFKATWCKSCSKSICIIYSGAALDEIKHRAVLDLCGMGVSDWENAKWRWTGEASGLKAITLINIRNHRWNLKSVSCCLTLPICTVSSSWSKQCISLAQQLGPIHRSASMGCGQVIKPDALTQGQKNGKMVDQVLEDWSLKFGGPKLPWNSENVSTATDLGQVYGQKWWNMLQHSVDLWMGTVTCST